MHNFVKLNARLLVALCVGMSWNSVAKAQMVVNDPWHAGATERGHANTARVLERQIQETRNLLEELKAHHSTTKEIKKIDEDIKKILEEIKESMIGTVYEDLVSGASDGEKARNKLVEIYQKEEGNPGLGLSQDASELESYQDFYGFLKASDIYREHEGLSAQRSELTNSVYFAGYAVAETLTDMEDRYTRFDDIEDEMSSVEDQKEREMLANILLLENGRALTKMMELQTLQIDLSRQQINMEIAKDDSRFTVWGLVNN
jgi:hypothetical protein